MGWKASNVWAYLLILVGLLLLLKFFGVNVGFLFWTLLSLAMVALGYYGIRRGSAGIGWIVFAIGLILLASRLWGLIALLLPVAFLAAGWMMLRKRNRVY